MKLLICVLLLLLGLGIVHRLTLSFVAQRPADYADTTPVFDLRTHLGGPLVTHGVIFGPTGRVATRFAADMRGSWEGGTGEGGTGTLAENFRYASGGGQQREWRIAAGEDGRFTATAADVIGEAKGQISGATLSMRYRLQLPEDAGGWQVDVTDWLYLGEDGVIVNRSEFHRFGLKLGELVGTIRPVRD